MSHYLISSFIARCERYIDRCVPNPCQQGGYCFNQVNSFKCVCHVDRGGEQCQIDQSDFYFYVVMFVFQYIFQVWSFYLLHLDDGPEVDWGWALYYD